MTTCKPIVKHSTKSLPEYEVKWAQHMAHASAEQAKRVAGVPNGSRISISTERSRSHARAYTREPHSGL